jgi:hypothetical protein
MYRVAMEQLARDDIAAAAAAHRELGREYDGAVAESLVERIGAEIDKRVDARLAQRGKGSQPSPAARPSWAVIVLGLGSMGIGIGAAGAVLNAGVSVTGNSVHNAVSGGQIALVALIWIIIGVINVAYARRR